MSDTATTHHAGTEAAVSQTSEPKPLVKPRPILFRVLLVAFVIWIALLVTLYVKSVYPLRHGKAATIPDQLPQR